MCSVSTYLTISTLNHTTNTTWLHSVLYVVSEDGLFSEKNKTSLNRSLVYMNVAT